MSRYQRLASLGFVMPDGQAMASYDAAGTGRRLGAWRPAGQGPTASVLGHLHVLRARSRDGIRNNGWLKHGLDNWVANEIGTGIRPRSLAPDPVFAATAKALWTDFLEQADADGVLHGDALVALAVRSRQEAGEAFIRLRPRRLSDGLPVPLQLQLLEAEHCPHHYNVPRQGGEIRCGIEFDRLGRRVAYWMHRSHPGEQGLELGQLTPVPASQVIHHYAPLRPGQVRGAPWTVQALIKTRDFDEYDDAELVRKKTRAAFTGVIKRTAYGEDDYKYDPFTGEVLVHDASGTPMGALEPGSFQALLPGEDITLFEGDKGGEGYAEFCRQQLLGAAASMNLPYEFLSGDMANINDRVLRVVLNEYHRVLEQTQWLLTIPQVLAPIWRAFIDAAVLAGKLVAPDYADRRGEYLRVDWRPDGWKYMHPVQDVQARLMEIGGGLNSQSGAAAERGWDAEDIDAQNARDAERQQRLGLKYTHAPGQVRDDH